MFTDLKWHHALNWRPWSYTDFSDPSALILNGIRGQLRRSKARTNLELVYDGDNSLDWSTAGGEWLRESGDEDLGQTSFWESNWRVGESLPKPLPGEIEIARIVISEWSYAYSEYGEQEKIAALQNIFSIRARWRSGRYRYRVVDDFNSRFHILPQSSQRALTLSELIELLQSGSAVGPDFECGGVGLVEDWWHTEFGQWAEEGQYPELKDCLQGAKVESDLYPMLPVWYEQRAEQWVAGKNKGSDGMVQQKDEHRHIEIRGDGEMIDRLEEEGETVFQHNYEGSGGLWGLVVASLDGEFWAYDSGDREPSGPFPDLRSALEENSTGHPFLTVGSSSEGVSSDLSTEELLDLLDVSWLASGDFWR